MGTIKKDRRNSLLGKKGQKSLRSSFGGAADYSAYMSKIAKARWRKHPEQRSQEWQSRHKAR